MQLYKRVYKHQPAGDANGIMPDRPLSRPAQQPPTLGVGRRHLHVGGGHAVLGDALRPARWHACSAPKPAQRFGGVFSHASAIAMHCTNLHPVGSQIGRTTGGNCMSTAMNAKSSLGPGTKAV